MSTYRINTHYAKALMLLSEETGTIDRVSEDMRLVSKVCAENRELNVVFNNPVIPKDKKLVS